MKFKKGQIPWNKGLTGLHIGGRKGFGYKKVVCNYCKNNFKKEVRRINECYKRNPNTKFYCSDKCKKLGHKSNFKGGNISPQGYKKIRINGKYVQEHRYLIEQFLGRKLNIKEHVHHINHNKLDNHLDNLQVLDIREHGHIEGKRSRGIPRTKYA